MSINLVSSLHINCEYGIFDNRHAYGDKYRCLVQNTIDVVFPEEVYIDTLSGTHADGKTNDNDIHFFIDSKSIQYFPRGMEKFFKNLKGIIIWHTLLKEIHQEDLKPYPNLNNLYLSDNDIEIIEDGLFEYNLDLEVIIFEKTKLIHIGPTVFSHLTKLTTLFFNGNKCTNLYSVKDRALTLKVITGVRNSCVSSVFLKFKKMMENLEEIPRNSVIASSPIYSQKVMDLQTVFKDSSFANFPPLKQKLQNLIEFNIISTHQDSCQVENVEQNILKAVDAKIEDLESRLKMLDEKLEKVMTNVKTILTML